MAGDTPEAAEAFSAGCPGFRERLVAFPFSAPGFFVSDLAETLEDETFWCREECSPCLSFSWPATSFESSSDNSMLVTSTSLMWSLLNFGICPSYCFALSEACRVVIRWSSDRFCESVADFGMA